MPVARPLLAGTEGTRSHHHNTPLPAGVRSGQPHTIRRLMLMILPHRVAVHQANQVEDT